MSEGRLFQWLEQRGAGVLLHPTSFPGKEGIGTLGEESHRFLDFLQAAGMHFWQICPLGPTGYGDSPYQCFSAFAGNPYLINLEEMMERGFLTEAELEPVRKLPQDKVDFGALWQAKWKLLARAHQRFVAAGRPDWDGESFEDFVAREKSWLEPYALFMAIKSQNGGNAWTEWPPEQRSYARASQLAGLAKLVDKDRDAQRFYQYVFFSQWQALRIEAQRRGIQIIGDMPIFVSADSADVWANPELFDLDEKTGKPRHMAGVPPDYFSEDGQLWGNPLYIWQRHADTQYTWWLARLNAAFQLYDILRIDHFRGFDEYWEIPTPAVNARSGKWRPGPGMDFFRAIQVAFPGAKIIAEDLGLLSPSVLKLRDGAGLPGMAVLQFAFGGKADNSYLPHNTTNNCVIYAGTHDNDTTKGWYAAADEKTKDHVRRYLKVNGSDISWDLVRAAYAATPRLAIVTLQDLLNLGSEARFNRPGKPAGNWQWRYRPEQLETLFGSTAKYLKDLAGMYGRLPDTE